MFFIALMSFFISLIVGIIMIVKGSYLIGGIALVIAVFLFIYLIHNRMRKKSGLFEALNCCDDLNVCDDIKICDDLNGCDDCNVCD
ncbi:hypothetical protein D3C80_1847900 [compost metagenome]